MSATIARTEIVPEIQAIEGVARADLTGGLEQRVFITLDPAKLAAASITSQQIVGVLQANNLTLPSGQLAGGRLEVPVSTIGTFTSVDRSRDLVVGFQRPAPGSGGATAASPHRRRPRALPGVGRPAASAAPVPRAAAARRRRRSRADPDHHRPARHRRGEARRDDRLRPHERRPGADAHRLEALEREHRRSSRRRPGEAGRDRRAPQGPADGHDRRRPVGLHQGIGRRARSAKAASAPSSRS